MKTLVVGLGALGGLCAARLIASGETVALAARTTRSAEQLALNGLRVSGVGGNSAITAPMVATLENFINDGATFDLVILATKAQDAITLAPQLTKVLASGGVIVPLQNGSVPRLLADQLGEDRVLGCLSNFGATMVSPGVYEQRNAGHLLIGEQAGGVSPRVQRICEFLGRAIDVRSTANFPGASWSKLLLNCSVTTIGAITGQSMRQYIQTQEGRHTFIRAYDEALAVATANQIRPETMLVDPIPPGWSGRSVAGAALDAWVNRIVEHYGDLKPSMLQDFERGRATEIAFINGYVADLGRKLGIPTPVNAGIVGTVRAIESGQLAPSLQNLHAIACA